MGVNGYEIRPYANLRRANLTRADLTEANLAGANLAGANLAGANLTEANLAEANLAGANLQCYGDMRRIKTLQIDTWRVGYTATDLQIGCQRHEIEKWRNWDSEAGRQWIAAMDSGALALAEKHLALVLAIIDASPAE